MAWNGVKADWIKDKRKNNNALFLNYVTAPKLNKYLTSTGKVDEVSYDKDTKKYTITYTNKQGTFYFIADENENIKFDDGFYLSSTADKLDNSYVLYIYDNENKSGEKSFKIGFSKKMKKQKVKWSITKGDKSSVKLSSNEGEEIKITPLKVGRKHNFKSYIRRWKL